MTPLHFLYYSLVGIFDVFGFVMAVSFCYSLSNTFYEKRLQIEYGERFKFMVKISEKSAQTVLEQPTENQIH